MQGLYKIFGMDRDGRLFQVDGFGWVRENGTYFSSLTIARKLLSGGLVMNLPDALDIYIAKVNRGGRIITTYGVLAESEG